MIDIRSNISQACQRYNNNYIQLFVELIAKFLAGSVFAIIFVAIFSFFIGLMILGVFIAFYDKSSYPVIDYLAKLLHGNFVFDFYYSYIHHNFSQIVVDYNLSSNIAKSGYLSIINTVIATISAYIIASVGLLSLIYSTFRFTFLDFKPKRLFFRIIGKMYHYIVKGIFIICIPALFISGFIALVIAYYIYVFIKLVAYILIPVSLILSVISFFFGKIIFSGIGLEQLSNLGFVNGVVFFAHYIWHAIYYVAFLSVFLHLQDFNENSSTQPAKSKKTNTGNNQLDIKIAGLEGEKKFQDTLDDLGTKLNSKYMSSGNMLYGQSWVAEIDFLVLVPNIGLVVVEVKNYSGEILCSNEDKWTRVKYDNYGNQVDTTYESNVSKQVITTTNQLKKILGWHRVNKWKITPVVVFVNPKAEIVILESNKPQTDVVTIDQFGNWLESLPKDYSQQFSDDDYQEISKAIEVAQNRYKNSDDPKVVAIRENEKLDNQLLRAH